MVRSGSDDAIKENGGVTFTSLISLLQSYLFKIVNLLVNLVGINWLLGLFGLALKPIEGIKYPKEDDFDEEEIHAVKENKRNHAVMSEDFDYQENSTKRCKPDDETEKRALENEDFGLYKKPVDDDRVKAISDFQNRLWNLKPDLTFVKKETVHVTDDEAGDSIRNLKVTIDETEMDNCSSKPIRDEIYKKVITPSESFDDVLNMSEDVSDIPTGDEFSDVISDLAVKENAGSLVEDGKDEAGTVTVPASEPDFTMDPSSPGKEIDHNANTTPSDATEADAFVCKIESNPTEKTSEENSADEQVKDYIKPLKEKVLLVKTYENLTQGNDSQQDLEAMEEKVKVANDVLEAAKLDYPVLLKPNYPVQEKPDYPVLEKPD